MRAILQRVTNASVVVDGKVVGEIKKGILALVGVAEGDSYEEDAVWMVKKILEARLFDDASGRRWGASVKSLGLEVLLVSQFTLHANTKKAKPDFHKAMGGPQAREFFDRFVADMRKAHGEDKIQTGEFGAMMQVSLTNDGPVTVSLDSWNKAECGGREPPVSAPTPKEEDAATPLGGGGEAKKGGESKKAKGEEKGAGATDAGAGAGEALR